VNLQRDLYDYGDSHDTLSATKIVKCKAILHCSRTGGILEILEKPLQLEAPVESRTVQVVPYTGYDTAEYVLGIGGKSRTDAEGRSPYEACWDRHDLLAKEAGDDLALRAIRATRKAGTKKKLAVEGLIAIAIDDELLLERRAIKTYLRKVFKKEMKVVGGSAICLVTGEKCEPARLHARVRGVPGCGGDFPLTSWNFQTAAGDGTASPRPQRYKQQGYNFPIAPRVSATIADTLTVLLKSHGVRIGDCRSVVVWGPEGSESFVKVISPYKVEDRLQAWKNLEKLDAGAMVHILMLKGALGRISVLSYDVVPVHLAIESLHELQQVYGRRSYEWKEIEPGRREPRPWAAAEGLSILGEMGRMSENWDHPAVDEGTRCEALRAVLLGKPLPESFKQALLAVINFRDLVADRGWARAQLRWLDYIDDTERADPS